MLLVTGGSLGARAINEAVDANLVALTEKYDVIHIRGRGKRNNESSMTANRNETFTNFIRSKNTKKM